MIILGVVAMGVIGWGWARPALADWELWLSPDEGAEVLDQLQTASESSQSAVVTPSGSVGQTFVPGRSSLFRFDLRVDNADDSRPGRVRLYRWKGSHKQTVASKPIFKDTVDLSGSWGLRTQSFFPRTKVRPGKLYYVELTGRGRTDYRVGQSISGDDPYPGGRALRNGRSASKKAKRDLWFRTWALSPESSDRFESPPSNASLDESEAGQLVRAPRLASDPKGRWFPPLVRSAKVTRASYLERIRNFGDRFRDDELARCREVLYGNAMREAFLYRVSCREDDCDERRVADAVAFFRHSHAWQFCTEQRSGNCSKECVPDAPIGFNQIDRPAMAYRWMMKSPSLEPEDRELIKEVLLDRARRFWPNRETSSHNRAMTASVGFRLLAEFYPDEPDASEWRAYARGNWNAFWAHRDTIEDSALYNAAVWLPAVLAYAEIAGLEGRIWSDRAFLDLVDRFAKLTIPLGTLPNYGDSVGWLPDPSGLVWLFEEASARTQIPEYRWLAHRIYNYATLNVRDDWPRRDAFYMAHPSLMGAYFSADETLVPRRPADQQEALLMSRAVERPSEFVVEPGRAIGSVFEATGSPLARITLAIRNFSDERPAQISLWRWRGDRKKTTARPPLYRDTIEMKGPDVLTPRSVLPFLSLDVGARYYISLERPEAPIAVEVDGRGSTKISFDAHTLSDSGSTVTDRVGVRHLTKRGPRFPNVQYEFVDERTPDKLVLRSGFDADDMHAVFNLTGAFQHGQAEMAALVSFVDGRSVLMSSGSFPYWFFGNVRLPQDESLAFLRRHWGGRYGKAGNGASVEHFSDRRAVTIASLRYRDPSGWQVRQQRRIFFVKNRFMLVRDRFVPPNDMTLSAGPVWHMRDLSADRGPNYFDGYNRQPLSNVWRVRNPDRQALVYFVPRSGLSADAVEVAAHLPPPRCPENSAGTVDVDCRAGPPFAAFQRWSGAARAGRPIVFDSLIIPHARKVPAERLAEGVRVLLATEGVAIEVQLGSERWLVVDNPSGALLDIEGLSTDARYAVARVAPDRVPYLLTQDASRIRWRGVERSWPVKTSVEFGAELPVERLPGW